MIKPGQVIGNNRIIDKIGEGGMGEVFKARDLILERDLAIKVLRPELAENKDLVERFRNEAVILGRLHHQNIATLYGITDFGAQNTFCMVMEFAYGETLKCIINQYPNGMPFPLAIELFDQILAALEHAHKKGIIHRDIKPANIMIDKHHQVKVMDFGIARILKDEHLTRTGFLIGTAKYMSPEQVCGQEAVASSDVYSLGILFYEMLTGDIPFSVTSEYELFKAHVELAPRPITKLINLSHEIEIVLLRALSKTPSSRYLNAGDFRRSLNNAVTHDRKISDTTTIFTYSGKKPFIHRTNFFIKHVKTRKIALIFGVMVAAMIIGKLYFFNEINSFIGFKNKLLNINPIDSTDNIYKYSKAEAEAKRQAELEAQRKAEAEAERQAELEAQHKAEAEAERQAELEAQHKAEAEAERQAELEAQRKAEAEAEHQAELAAQRKAEAEAEAERQAKLEAQRKAEAKAKRQAELEAQRKAKAEAKRQADLEAQRKAAEAEAEAKRQAELAAQRKAAEAEAEAKRQAELEAQRKAEAEAERQAKLEAQRKAEAEAKRQAELEVQRKAEAEAERQAELEAQRKAAEAEAKAKDQTELAAQRKTEAGTKRQAKLVTQRKAEAETKRQAKLVTQRKAEAEAKRQAKLVAQRKAEAEAKRQAELETLRKAKSEAERQADLEAQLKQEAKAKRLADQAAQRRKEVEAKRRVELETQRKVESAEKQKAVDETLQKNNKEVIKKQDETEKNKQNQRKSSDFFAPSF